MLITVSIVSVQNLRRTIANATLITTLQHIITQLNACTQLTMRLTCGYYNCRHYKRARTIEVNERYGRHSILAAFERLLVPPFSTPLARAWALVSLLELRHHRPNWRVLPCGSLQMCRVFQRTASASCVWLIPSTKHHVST